MTLEDLNTKIIARLNSKYNIPAIVSGDTICVAISPTHNLFTIKAEKTKSPTRAETFVDDITLDIAESSAPKRLRLEINLDASLLEQLGFKNHYYFPVIFDDIGTIKIFKMADLMISIGDKYMVLKSNKELAAKIKMPSNEPFEIALKAKIAAKKKSKEARTAVFEQMQKFLKEAPGKIESVLENEYVNLTLDNGLRLRLMADAAGVVISDVELPKLLKLDQVQETIAKLNKSF